MSDLTRPIVGIDFRIPQEVFDIMCDRFRRASCVSETAKSDTQSGLPIADETQGTWSDGGKEWTPARSGYTAAEELRDLKQSIMQSTTLADFMAVRKTVEAIDALGDAS